MINKIPKCIACESGMEIFLDGMFDDRYGFSGHYDVYRCTNCQQCQTMPLLNEEDLPSLYGEYYPRKEIDISALISQIGVPSEPAQIKQRYRNGTDNQGQYIAKTGMKVLDYGCGTGASLLEIIALGAEAYGIEADPNVKQVVDALGLRIHIGTLDNAPFADEKFDLIVLNQVLEHIPSPENLLVKFKKMLKPKGRLVLSFPNSGSVYARFFKRLWINWHIPYHLHHFNPKSSRLFLEKNGWRVISLRTITPNLWTVLQCRAGIETTSIGEPNPMWTGQSFGNEKNNSNDKKNKLLKYLRQFALKGSSNIPKAILTIFNRSVDKCGFGDSLLIELELQILGVY